MNNRLSILLVATLALSYFGHTAFAAPLVNVRDFGAKGDAETDDTEAIIKALAESPRVHFPAGVYLITDGIELPENAYLSGDGSPSLAVFPRGGDDKRCFAPGKRKELPGTTLLFRGRGEKASSTGRSDLFSSLRYAIKTAPIYPYHIEGLAIALDLDVYDADGTLTTPKNDNRSDFEVGLLVDDSAAGTVRDVAIFGFWKKAGLTIVSRGLGDNPDYNTFWNCSFMGEHGVALLGQENAKSPGLSGTQFYGCRIFANDHHSRGVGQWGTAALYIDGDTAGKRADLNGHYFFGGGIRTYSNTAVKLDHASNVSFHGVVFEVPAFEAKNNEGADTSGQVVATANTRDVHFFGCRMHSLGLDELGKTMTDGNLVAFPDPFRGISVHEDGSVVRLLPSHKSGPGIQLTEDGSSANNGWSIRLEKEGRLAFRHQNQLQAHLSSDGMLHTKAIESKAIKATSLSLGNPLLAVVKENRAEVRGSRIILKSEEATNLNQLTGGTEGQLLILERAPTSSAITIPINPEGNIPLKRAFSFSNDQSRLTLMKAGDQWVEISRTPAEE